MTDNANTAVVPHILTALPSLYRRRWEDISRSGEDTKTSLKRQWQSFIDYCVGEWSGVTQTGTMLSLTWLCLLPISANVGRMALLFTGPGILCALATVFVSMVYVKNRHLFEHIMQDKGLTDLPFNLWTFLSLPSLYFAWSLLLLGLVLFFCLFMPRHQPFSWDVAILNIPIPILSTGLSLLVTLIPCSLVARNFQALSQAIEPPTAPNKPSESKPMDLSSPSPLESTELVSSEKLLGFLFTAAHVILGLSVVLLSIGNFYNDPITRISFITSITTALFAILLQLQASLQLLVHTKRSPVLPITFLALSVLASLFGLLAWPIRRFLG